MAIELGAFHVGGGGLLGRVGMSMNLLSVPRGVPLFFFGKSRKGKLICALEMEGVWRIPGRRGGPNSLY